VKKTSERASSLEDKAKEILANGDIAKLYEFFMGNMQEMAGYFSQKIENYKTKLYSAPNTSIDNFSIKLNNIDKVEIQLFYIWSRIPPKCPFCERLLQHEDMNWLRAVSKENILTELNLDKNKYTFKEIRCDWNDRWASEEHDSHYSDQLTDEGMNYFFARGCDIQYFPSMIIKFTPIKGKIRKETIRALGKWDYVFTMKEGEQAIEIDPETKQPVLDFFFNVREIVLTFLEGNTSRLDERIKDSTHGEQFGTKVNDKPLFDK